jgi:hypothetical protein
MEKEYIHGRMEGSMKVNISMIKNMGLEFILGLIRDAMKGFGNMENSMERGSIFRLIKVLNMGFGKRGKEFSGLKNKNMRI